MDSLQATEELLERAYGDEPGPTVPRVVEVITGDDDADAFASRLLARIDRTVELAGERAARRFIPLYVSRMSQRLPGRPATEAAMDEGSALVREVLEALRQDLRNRVQADLAVHLVPKLQKENTT